jgi:hypothetical protein
MAKKKGAKKRAKAKAKKDCPDSFTQICKDLNAWAEEWEDWGLAVRKKVNDCCGNGDPEPIPAPPKPPFK